MRWLSFENVRRVRGNYSFRSACSGFRFESIQPGIAIDIWNICSAITYCHHIRALGKIVCAKTVTAIPASEIEKYRVVFLLEPCIVLKTEALEKPLRDISGTDFFSLGYHFCDGNRNPVFIKDIVDAKKLGYLKTGGETAHV